LSLYLSRCFASPGASLLPYTTLFRSVLMCTEVRLTLSVTYTKYACGWWIELDWHKALLHSLGTEQTTRNVALNQSLKSIWELNRDRKSTRLNSSHVSISYAVFCLKKK